MSRRIVTLLVLAVAAAVMLLGRHHDADSRDPAVTDAGSSTPTTPPAPTPVQSPTPTDMIGSSLATPEPTQREQESAHPTAAVVPRNAQQTNWFAPYAAAAEAFMADYARPPSSVTEQQWWAKVANHLTSAAAAAYAGTDPQNVPFTKVTGAATVLLSATPPDPGTEAPNDLLLLARVPTDAGWYRVELTTLPEGIRIVRATPEHAPS